MSTAVAPDDRAVVRALVSLKVRLLRNGLRRSPGRAAGYVLGTAFGLLIGLSAAAGLVVLHGRAGAADAAAVLTAGLTVCWAAMPLFFFSGDESGDPTRLTMLPLRPPALLRGTLLGSLIGPGPLINGLLLAGAAAAAGRGAASLTVAVAAVPLTLLTLIALTRAVAAGNARVLSSRRGKDFAIFGGLLFAVLVQLGNLGVQSSLNGSGKGVDLSVLHPYASVVRWIPPVAAIDAVRSAGEGAYLVAALQLALTAGLLAVLLRWWLRSLQDLMVTGDSSTLVETSPAASTRAARGWRLLPAGRVGAVAQRHLRYAWREPRAKAAIFTGIGMTGVFAVLSVVQGWGSVYVIAAGGLMLGLQGGNLFGMDGSGFWMVAATLTTRQDARDELRGRVLAVLAYGLPVLVLLAPVVAAVTGGWGDLAPALGLALAAFGTSLGLGCLFSVYAPFALPADGNPMRNAAPGQNGVVMANAFGSMVGVALCCLPVGALLGYLLLDHHPAWPVLPVGVLYGALLALLGIRIASRALLARAPEILARVIER
ncbi:transporter [Streptomyces sp. TLI_171]|uniref:transporter n=1 Tax=Streptomyces sp. TLI_171 TaxID=1938859 RepID=UPI000C588DA0|nr:transporter [Streptomyces sp. TLI_171]RKE19575.1 ABC-2 type transport system permease protein [Streptomyces sp. TLI_171]